MIGKTIANYTISRKIGEGGTGVVYEGTHNRLNRLVAIKVLSPQLLNHAEMRGRFEQEAQVLAGLQHPNIVTLYDFVEQDNNIFLIMEFVDGNDLGAHIQNVTGPIVDDVAIGYMKKILSAVSYAHSRNIVHRDIKPSNIVVTATGDIKILDFGIAKLLTADHGMTEAGKKIGTVLYMSPEQVLGKAVDARTDIYSLGVTLYQMVTGFHPFANQKSEYAISHEIVNNPLPDPRTSYPLIGKRIMQAIEKATAKNPDDRFQTCIEFLHFIEVVDDVHIIDIKPSKQQTLDEMPEDSVSVAAPDTSIPKIENELPAATVATPTVEILDTRQAVPKQKSAFRSFVGKYKVWIILLAVALVLVAVVSVLWFRPPTEAPYRVVVYSHDRSRVLFNEPFVDTTGLANILEDKLLSSDLSAYHTELWVLRSGTYVRAEVLSFGSYVERSEVATTAADTTYVVRMADTWDSIYDMFGVCRYYIAEQAANAQGIDRSNNPMPGAELLIPLRYSAFERFNPLGFVTYSEEGYCDQINQRMQTDDRQNVSPSTKERKTETVTNGNVIAEPKNEKQVQIDFLSKEINSLRAQKDQKAKERTVLWYQITQLDERPKTLKDATKIRARKKEKERLEAEVEKLTTEMNMLEKQIDQKQNILSGLTK